MNTIILPLNGYILKNILPKYINNIYNFLMNYYLKKNFEKKYI